jgi:nitrogen regulatory protein P-II 1
MKEIKAYVRMNMGEHVVHALSALGGHDFSIMEIQRIKAGLPRGSYDFSVVLGEPFEPMLKFEMVCRDENAGRVVEAIRKAATTGRPGDGKIFVATVDEAVAISSGNRGEGVLSV